jgi:hypothetical protein
MVITRVFPVPAPANTSNGPSVHFTAACCSGLRSKKRAMRHPKEEPRINAMRRTTQRRVPSKFSIPISNGHELTRTKTLTADEHGLTRIKTNQPRMDASICAHLRLWLEQGFVEYFVDGADGTELKTLFRFRGHFFEVFFVGFREEHDVDTGP